MSFWKSWPQFKVMSCQVLVRCWSLPVRLWPLPEVKLQLIRRVSTRGVRCCHYKFYRVRRSYRKGVFLKTAKSRFVLYDLNPSSCVKFESLSQNNVKMAMIECAFPLRWSSLGSQFLHWCFENVEICNILPLITSGDLNFDLTLKNEKCFGRSFESY